jgi:hypothetical protein
VSAPLGAGGGRVPVEQGGEGGAVDAGGQQPRGRQRRRVAQAAPVQVGADHQLPHAAAGGSDASASTRGVRVPGSEPCPPGAVKYRRVTAVHLAWGVPGASPRRGSTS